MLRDTKVTTQPKARAAMLRRMRGPRWPIMEAFCGPRRSSRRSRVRPNVPGCVPRCGSTSLNSGTTYLDLGTTYLDASQDMSQTSLDASLDPDTVSIPRFYRGGLVEAPKVKASFGTHPGTWGRIQGRGDTRQGRRKASIIGQRNVLLLRLRMRRGPAS